MVVDDGCVSVEVLGAGELVAGAVSDPVLVAVVGSVVGILVAVPMYGGLLLIAPVLIGFKEPFIVDPSTAVIYAAVAVVVALLGAAWPAWRTAKIEVLAALQYE